MPHSNERSAAELYASDPERADTVMLGRRRVLTGAGLAALGAAVGAAIPFGRHLPAGLLPIALAQGSSTGQEPHFLDFPGKDKRLVILGDRPLVAETPEHLLDDATTPVDKFFIRNNGQIPDDATNTDAWTIRIDGEVNTPLELKLGEIKQRFQAQTHRMVLECGGNGRSFFSPPGRGNQWTNGGAGAAEWTGVALKEVLAAAGLKADAKFTGSYGSDAHLSGDASKHAISRGNPIERSLDPHAMIVWAMNGQPLTTIHGAPVRLIVPGGPGSLSTKWLNRVVVRATPHDGQGMGGTSYRVPVTPIVPGSNDDGKTFRDLEWMPLRAIITNPAHGARLPAGTRDLALRGAAWDGHVGVGRVDVSIDFGQTWQQAEQTTPTNRYDWTRWTRTVKLPSDGYFEVWVRATDRNGVAQPLVAANWNPQGYGANPINRIAVLVG
jgi:DMSO/TMAO reductase YedYZ molybdopterin-dependent catalytic subunit